MITLSEVFKSLSPIISIVSGLVTSLIGLLIGIYLQNRQFNIEAQKVHLEDLKKHVVETFLKVFEEGGLIDLLEWKKIDKIPVPRIALFEEELYIDLLINHYTALKDLIVEYYNVLKLKKEKEEEFRKRIEDLLKKELKNRGLKYTDKENVWDAAYLPELRRYLEHLIKTPKASTKCKKEGIIIRVGDHPIYWIGNKADADKICQILEDILKELRSNDLLINIYSEIKKYEDKLWCERDEIGRALRIIRLKTNLNTRRKWLFFSACPYVKASFKLEKKKIPKLLS